MAEKLLRYDDNLAADIKAIAAERHISENQLMIEALSLLRDRYYAKNKAAFLNDEMLSVIRASYKMAESSINNKTNRVLSEVAIQACIQNQILANSLQISKSNLSTYRLRAVDFLKSNQRILKLDEVVEEEG